MAQIVGAAVGAAAALLVQAVIRKRRADVSDRSTTSSAGGGAAAYETKKAVDEYIQFHYGAAEDLLPYANGPKVGVLSYPAVRPTANG